MIKMGDSPGSDNGTGFFQTLASLKIREFYEKLSGVEVEVEAPAKVAA
jgi:phosphoribulokinase